MFQFPAFATYPYVFRISYLKTMLVNHSSKLPCYSDFTSTLGGFPHSEIAGSKLIRSSPTLIAAYHVLHRLCMPRHPPVALKTLDRSHCQCPSVHVPEDRRSKERDMDNQRITQIRRIYSALSRRVILIQKVVQLFGVT